MNDKAMKAALYNYYMRQREQKKRDLVYDGRRANNEYYNYKIDKDTRFLRERRRKA